MSDGNCEGSCGQISQPTIVEFAPGWDQEKLGWFFSVWDRWHLNDMRAGSKVQEDFLRANPVPKNGLKSYYQLACEMLAEEGINPDRDGYKYGSAWKTEEVPADVLEFLRALPDSDRKPAWV